MKSNCYQKYVIGFVSVKKFRIWGILFAFKNATSSDVTNSTIQIFVKPAIMFSKSFWSLFTGLTFFDKFYIAHGALRVAAHLLKCFSPWKWDPSVSNGISSLGNGSIDSVLNLGTPLFIYYFSTPSPLLATPKRLELQVPPNWDLCGLKALWCEMYIFQRCRHRQT